MGKDTPAKRTPSSVTRNGKTRSRQPRRPTAGCGLIFLIALCFLCGGFNVFAQSEQDRSAAELSRLTYELKNGNVEEKRSALFQLRNLQTEGASRIAMRALSDPNEMVRATAAAAIVFAPQNEAAAMLVPLLKDKSEFVRREAASALGRVASRDTTASLLDFLAHEKTVESRSAAAIALGQIGDVSAIQALLAILGREPSEDTEFLRRSAARSLGQIAESARDLKRIRTTPENFLPGKYKSVSDSGPATAQNYPHLNEAITRLTAVLQDKREADDTRREAAFALGSLANPSAVAALQKQLSGEDVYLVEICKEALLKIDAAALRN